MTLWVRAALACWLFMIGCGGATAASEPAQAPATGSEPAPVVVVPSGPEHEEPALATARVDNPVDAPMEGAGADSSVFEITGRDPALGRPDALVTVVVFGDIQCPFTKRYFETLEQLRNQYGDGDLRIVWKHLPLPFHREAAPAAEASIAVHTLGGPKAFFCFLGELFDDQANLGDGLYRSAAQKCGVAPAAMDAEVRTGGPGRKVEEDKRIATATNTTGTPGSYVNGIRISGAQPLNALTDAVDKERSEAQKIAAGTSPLDIHAARVKENFSKPEPRTSTPSPSAVNTTIYKVPIGQSPVLGSPQALVTLVMFQDFECPFCRRAATTVEQLRREFGNDLRVVFKHDPLPFHKQAMPAAQLAMEARAQKGNTGFWAAYDALFAEARLDDAVLDGIAQRLRLNSQAVRSAVTNNRHRAGIDADVMLARQLGAMGTPTFFVNGRKLTGAQPIEKFRELINEVLPQARALTQRGIPRARVYDETIKNGSTAP